MEPTISLKIESTSATKRQLSNAKLLFGAKGEALIKTLEDLRKVKELDTKVLDHLFDVLAKDNGDSVLLTKYSKNAVGKKNIERLKLLPKQKTLLQVIGLLESLKVPKAFE